MSDEQQARWNAEVDAQAEAECEQAEAESELAPARGWTAPPAEQREMSERVERRDGYDWRCGHCVETAQECLNGDRGCPYRQPKREQSNIGLSNTIVEPKPPTK